MRKSQDDILYLTLEGCVFSWRRALQQRGCSEIPHLTCCLCFRIPDKWKRTTCCGPWNGTSITWSSPDLIFLFHFTFCFRIPHGPIKIPEYFFSPFLEALSQMSWHLLKGRRALICKKKKFRLPSQNSPTKGMNASVLFLLGASPFLPWLLYGAETFSWEGAREGSVGGGGEEMPFWLKESEKKWWSAELGFVKPTQDTPRPFSRGISCFLT